MAPYMLEAEENGRKKRSKRKNNETPEWEPKARRSRDKSPADEPQAEARSRRKAKEGPKAKKDYQPRNKPNQRDGKAGEASPRRKMGSNPDSANAGSPQRTGSKPPVRHREKPLSKSFSRPNRAVRKNNDLVAEGKQNEARTDRPVQAKKPAGKDSRQRPASRNLYAKKGAGARKSQHGSNEARRPRPVQPRRPLAAPPRFNKEEECLANPHFADLGVRAECLSVLTKQSILVPMPVQQAAIPPALAGQDLVAIAQTGTGKTLAFSLPLLARMADASDSNATALVLSPTRELAQQIYEVMQPLARTLGLKATCIYGGVNMDRQVRDLRQGGGVIIATPGRLLDHIRRGNIDFSRFTSLVLDEADRMLDMGFIPDIRRILEEIPTEHQTLLFSATFPDEISHLSQEFLKDPLRLEIQRDTSVPELVRQHVYTVDHEGKMELLTKLLGEQDVRSAIIFVRTKKRADRVAKALGREGFSAESIHGDRSQHQRRMAITAFARGQHRYLVATDVAARGIDIGGISHVINYDIPECTDDYTHRIGRTARAHASGDAITFVSRDDVRTLRQIEKAQGRELDQVIWEKSIALSESRKSGGRPGRCKGRRKSSFGKRNYKARGRETAPQSV
ncbi:MAG: DEAD/DEAH box helicase [bacterium]